MSELKNLKPGEARCPDHPSTKELVSRDCTGAAIQKVISDCSNLTVMNCIMAD